MSSFLNKENDEKKSEDKLKYSLIILVLASHNERYDQFIKIWKKYDGMHPDIKVLYVYGKGHIKEDDSEIISEIEESYIPGLLLKTLYAFEYILRTYEFDYLVRTTLSNFFYLPKLYDYVKTLPKTELYGGYKIDGYGRAFVTGFGMYLSKDHVQYILANRNAIDENVLDDITIGKFMRENGKKIIEIPYVKNLGYHQYPKSITDPKIIKEMALPFFNSPNFHYRFKDVLYKFIDDPMKMQIVYDLYYSNA